MRKIGIYCITNLLNGKVYYGSSNDVMTRIRVHKSKLNKRTHANPHLQNAWNKYGESNFCFELVEEVTLDMLQKVEQEYLDWCKRFSQWSYNIGYDAECATRGLKFGPPSEEHRRKIGLANRGSKNANFGKKLSVDTRNKMSRSKKGVSKPPMTDDHKKNLSSSLKGKNHYRYDFNVYRFYHPEIGVRQCTRHDLILEFSLNKRGVGNIIDGNRLTYKKWRVYAQS